MACSSAAGADAAALLFRQAIASPVAGSGCLRRCFAVSCRTRDHDISAQPKRPQGKNGRPNQRSSNMKLFRPVEERSKLPIAGSRAVVQPHQKSTSGADPNNGAIKQTYETVAATDKEKQEEFEGENGGSNFQLEDLVGMIQNTQKNILLLNQARLQALKDVDKILSEKEALQKERDILEMKLSETDARLKLATEGKVNPDINGDQFEKFRKEMSSESASCVESHGRISKSPLVMGLDDLKEENVLLKADLQFLKTKLIEVAETEECLFKLEKEQYLLDATLRELESRFIAAQADILKLGPLQFDARWEKVEKMQSLIESAANQVEHAALVLDQNNDIQHKVDRLKASLGAANASEFSCYFVELLQQKVETVQEHLQACDEEIHSQILLYEQSVEEYQETLGKLIEESERRTLEHSADDVPLEFWSRMLLMIDGWSLEKKISSNDANMLRDMAWKRDSRIREVYFSSTNMKEMEVVENFLKMTSSGTSSGLHIVHIAAEMAPMAKVGGLADVISGLSKALQKNGNLVEIVLPKYDCMQHDQIKNLKVLDMVLQSYFEGNLFNNKIWTGTVEGLPVYFIEPQHPAKFFWRAQYYGEHDDFKRFSYFSRAVLELLYQSGKKIDIIHCHDWQTAFVAPLYWDLYANRGFNSARICFTCHNFEYQGTAPAPDLACCGLDVEHLDKPDRMRDNSHGRINVVKGAIVYSNIVTTVSPTYALEVRSEGGRGLQDTLKIHSRKFVGILNGIDTETWNPSIDRFLKVQYNANDLQGKAANKMALRKQLNLSSTDASQPLVGCITRLVPQKGVHLIRHAIYKTAELGGQFVLLGSSPIPHIQREFEGIADHFQNSSSIRLLLKYDDALSHWIFAASDMFIVPSLFEPCGLTQMIAMRYGSVPIVRKTGGLNDSVFDFDDESIPMELQNGFTFTRPDEQDLSSAMERAFSYYTTKPAVWKQLVQKDMRIDFSWNSSASQYEDLYQRAVAQARAAIQT